MVPRPGLPGAGSQVQGAECLGRGLASRIQLFRDGSENADLRVRMPELPTSVRVSVAAGLCRGASVSELSWCRTRSVVVWIRRELSRTEQRACPGSPEADRAEQGHQGQTSGPGGLRERAPRALNSSPGAATAAHGLGGDVARAMTVASTQGVAPFCPVRALSRGSPRAHPRVAGVHRCGIPGRSRYRFGADS